MFKHTFPNNCDLNGHLNGIKTTIVVLVVKGFSCIALSQFCWQTRPTFKGYYIKL